MKVMRFSMPALALLVSFAASGPVCADATRDSIDRHAKAIEAKMIAWRRDIHNVALTNRMVPTLQRVVGADKVVEIKPRTPSEDFSFYAREIPALFYSSASRRPACRRRSWRSTTRRASRSTNPGCCRRCGQRCISPSTI